MNLIIFNNPFVSISIYARLFALGLLLESSELVGVLTTRKKWIFYASLRMHPVLPDSTERTPRARGARGTLRMLLLDSEIKKWGRFEKDTANELRVIVNPFATKSNIYAADICLADRHFSHRWIYYGLVVLKFRSTRVNENVSPTIFQRSTDHK